ncbi:unnamed protein product [Caenorhabditis sp. 36 PRJEB53466]|nr:unnamed protein product [Caenorhabditis sp. 36 PRJEB53466]
MNSTWSACLFLALLAVSVCAIAENENNYLQELVDAGISQETAEGIVAVVSQHNQDGADPNKTGRTIFEQILQETDDYVKTRPAADQTAYAAFVAAKKSAFEKPDSA